MKKILFIVVMMLSFCVNANAQWHISETKADELKGTKASKNAIFLNEEGNFAITDAFDYVVMIGTNKGLFDYERNSTLKTVNMLIGYYVEDKLVEKSNVTLYVGSGGDTAYSYENKDFFNKVVNHLKYKGSIRIIIERYNRLDLDLIVPMNKDLPFN